MTSPLHDRKNALTLKELISDSEIIYLKDEVFKYHQEFYSRLSNVQRYALKHHDQKLFTFVRNLIEIYQSGFEYSNDDKLVAKFKLEHIIKEFDKIFNNIKIEAEKEKKKEALFVSYAGEQQLI